MHPYKKLKKFSTDIYTIDGSFGKSPLGRRMTVVKTENNELIIHSGIQLEDRDLDTLNQLGSVSVIIVPNTFHKADAVFYKLKYPKAKLLVPENLTAKELAGVTPDGLITDVHHPWKKELLTTQIAGTKTKEVAFFHLVSKTLILTDLAFNFEKSDFRGFTALVMSLNKADKGFAPTQLSKLLFFQDREALGRSLQEILKWPFENIIISHGRNIIGNGKSEFKKAFDYLMIP